MKIEFLEFTDRHVATGKMADDGLSVTYTCSKCPGWSRTFNFTTGKMTTTGKDKYFYISHAGSVSAMSPDMMSINIKHPELIMPVRSNDDSFSKK